MRGSLGEELRKRDVHYYFLACQALRKNLLNVLDMLKDCT